MSLKRKRSSSTEKEPYRFESKHVGADLTIIAGEGENQTTFYADLYTLVAQSEQLATRFDQRNATLNSDGYLVEWKEHDPAIVRSFLALHYYGEVGQEPSNDLLENWVDQMLNLCVYLLHGEAIDHVFTTYVHKLPIRSAYALIDKYQLSQLCDHLVKRYETKIVPKSSAVDFCIYLVGLPHRDRMIFRHHLTNIMRPELTSLVEKIAMLGYMTAGFEEYCKKMIGDIPGVQYVRTVLDKCLECKSAGIHTVGVKTKSMRLDLCVDCFIDFLFQFLAQ
jgi:hypothetical protein